MADACPRCGDGDVRFGSRRLRDLLRRLVASRKRYCASCGTRWVQPRRALKQHAQVAAVVAAALVFAVLGRGIARWQRSSVERATSATTDGPKRASLIDLPAGSGGLADPAPSDADQARALHDGGLVAGGGDGREKIAALVAPGGFHHAAALEGRSGGSLGDLLKSLRSLLKLTGGSKADAVRDADTLSKKELWDKYGQFFGSKEQAKSAYDEYKRRKASGGVSRELGGAEPQ